MRNQEEWEKTYSSNSLHHKNEYPNTEVVSFIMNNFGKIKDKTKIKILDLGCGWGNNLSFLKEKGFDYYGIDFSKTAVEHCKKYFKNVLCENISNLPYEDNFFDCVFDRASIQHNSFEKQKKIISEVKKVLKKNGKFFSILISETTKPLNFETSYLAEEKVRELLSIFRAYTLDYTIKTSENQKEISKWWNTTAIK